MNLVTGLALGLLIVVLGAGGLTVFALALLKREHPGGSRSQNASNKGLN
ncbi:MAG: hypothetical protein KGI81_04600 [Betaproteobacteria bacterium]|nr:hypothetical protein [Betaproteobacteria bacterium]